MKPQDVAVFEEKLSGFAAWKWVFFRLWETETLAPGGNPPGALFCMTGMPVFCGESPHRRSYRRT